MERLAWIFLLGTATAPVAAQTDSPWQILSAIQERWKQIDDYQCQMLSTNSLGDVRDTKELFFWFKRPHQVRIRLLSGEKEGSELSRDRKGNIYGKKGGLLRFIKARLGEDDPRIKNLRGRKFYNADWGTVLQEFIEHASSSVRFERLPDETFRGCRCYVLAASLDGRDSRVTKDIIWVDTAQHLILRRKQFEGSNIVNEVAWWYIQLNNNPEDDFFRFD